MEKSVGTLLQSKVFTLFIMTSPYSCEKAAMSVRLAAAAIGKGHRVNIIASAGKIVVLEEDAQRRGFRPEDMEAGIQWVDSGGLVDLLVAAGKAVGTF